MMTSGRNDKVELLLLSSKRVRKVKSKQKVGLVPISEARANISRPLIFVPGIMASSLAIKKANGELEYFWPPPYTFSIPEMIAKMRNGLESPIRAQADEKVSVRAIGLFPLAYNYLINAIEIWGYVRNQNFWIFPYDWRQSNDISGKLLADFITKKIEEGKVNRNDGVDVVNHSMGGLVTRSAALQHKAPIRRTVYIASPHYGSPLSYFGLHPHIGPDVGFARFLDQPPIENTLNLSFAMASSSKEDNNSTTMTMTTTTIPSLDPWLKEIFRNFPSMYELLPDFYYLEKKPLLYADTTPIYGVDSTYLNNEWKFSEENALSMTRNAMKFKKEKLGKKLPGNKENNLIIYGIDEPTDDTIIYQTRFFMSGSDPQSSFTANHEFSQPYDSGQHGDSWVPTLSAMGSMSGNTSEYPNSKSIQGIHTQLPNYFTTLENIRKFLINSS
jgi:pimeloyl-ACP methyl ester carboxylesterase